MFKLPINYAHILFKLYLYFLLLLFLTTYFQQIINFKIKNKTK